LAHYLIVITQSLASEITLSSSGVALKAFLRQIHDSITGARRFHKELSAQAAREHDNTRKMWTEN